MNKDIVNLIVTVVTSIFAVISTTYHSPVVGIIVFAFGVIAYIVYVVYVVYRGANGNSFIRLLPVLILLTVGSIIY